LHYKLMSALTLKADMCSATMDVCLAPKADMCSAQADAGYGPIAAIQPLIQ